VLPLVLLLASTLEYTITVMVWCCDVAVTTALKEERASLQNLPTARHSALKRCGFRLPPRGGLGVFGIAGRLLKELEGDMSV
jgi:hypothetical protein